MSGQKQPSKYKYGHCFVEGCPNSRKKNPKMLFHIIPTNDPPRFKRWLVALHLNLDTPERLLKAHIVCGKHFVSSDYKTTKDNFRQRRLNHDAVPSIGINTRPMLDKMDVLKAWEETAVRPELSDEESLMECDGDELELSLALSSEEDEDQTDPTGSSVLEDIQETQEQENKELLEDQEIFLFAPIEEEDEEEEMLEEEREEEEVQEVQMEEKEEEEMQEVKEEVQMEESSAAGDAALHAEEECSPDWTGPAPKRTRLHSPERSSHTPQSSASSRSLTGFKLNGSHVALLPVGGGVKLKLISTTGGSACGFTCVKLSPIATSSTPVETSNSKTMPVHHYNNITPVHTSNSKATPIHTSNSKATPSHHCNNITIVHTSKPCTSSTAPKTDIFPVITGVVCGPTAKQVVSSCIATLPPVLSSTPRPAVQPQTLTSSGPVAHSLHNKPSPESVVSSRGRPLKPKGPDRVKPLEKGPSGQVRPPDCTVCHSQYKMVPSLRGFVCLCSIEIIQGLGQAEIFKGHFKTKHRLPRSTSTRTDPHSSKTCTPSLLPPPLHHPMSPARHRVTPPMPHLSPVTPPRVSSSLSSTSASPPAGLRPSASAPPPPPEQEKLVILVEDFFYGTDEGLKGLQRPMLDGTRRSGPYTCDHCLYTLENNISFMAHTQQHIEEMYKGGDRVNHCHHCYRDFQTPFRLRRHLEVHSPNNSSPTCKICELSYENEPALLHHMKCTHQPGEMPYVCQVCEYRSSFYSSVVRHFREVHVNTSYLLCVYCLKVFKSRAAYQNHTTRHKKKFVYNCARCRLLFLFARDRKEHKQRYHKTHIRPRQLEGLKPGTRVTVRLAAEPVEDKMVNSLVASPELPSCLSVPHGPGPSQHLNSTEPPPVILLDDDSNDVPDTTTSQYTTMSADRQESQGGEWRDMQESLEAELEPAPSQLTISASCIECQHAVSSIGQHFVAVVSCRLCSYATYCSRAYANHMMSNHVIEKTTSNYLSMYQSYPRLPRKLRCQFCTYMTTTGDMMANHLAEHPGHRAVAVNESEEQRVSKPGAMAVKVSEEQSVSNPGGGSFIPIHLIPAGPASPRLSINTLPSPLPLPSSSPLSPTPSLGISATTLTFQSPQASPDILVTKKESEKRSTRSQRPPPLSVSELQMVLYALCNGVPQAAQYFHSDPALIRAWTLEQAKDMIKDNTNFSDRLAEWVLTQREQQLCVSEDSLMRAASSSLSSSSCGLREAYCWAVDFMLSHSLSLQPLTTDMDSRGPNRRLPRNLSKNTKMFTLFLQKQLQTGVPPGAVGYLDELSVFMDPARLAPSAYGLFTAPQADTRPLLDIVLCGLADGTCFSPVVFYAGASPVLPRGFPTNIILLTAPDKFTELSKLDLWHRKVWRPHMSNHSRGVLIMDTHRGHLHDHFLSTLSSSHTMPVVIPIGCSSRLQPLDVCITPVVREFLQARWSQLLSDGGVEDLSLEQLVVTLCCWVSEVASALSQHQDILRRSFAMVSSTSGKMEPVGANEMIQTLTQALID